MINGDGVDERSVTWKNLNFYMINSSDGFFIIEHREPPHGQQVLIRTTLFTREKSELLIRITN